MLLTLRIIFLVRFKGRNVYCPNFHFHLFCLFLKDAKRSKYLIKQRNINKQLQQKQQQQAQQRKQLLWSYFEKKKKHLFVACILIFC